MDFKGSQTEKNLNDAFAGESKARNMYTFFASQARKDGYVQMAEIFEKTANNEKEHAKIWFKLLNDGAVKNTETNLETSIKSENYENVSMYPGFAKTAREEGFDDIAALFEGVAKIEKYHALRYEKLFKNLENKEVFETPEAIMWECSNCGYRTEGKKAPEKCPVCDHPRDFFEQKNLEC